MNTQLKYVLGGRPKLATLLVFGAHIPTNHHQVYNSNKFIVKGLVSAGFTDVLNGEFSFYGKSESLNIGTTETGESLITQLLAIGNYWRALVEVRGYLVPVLMLSTQENCPFTFHQKIEREVLSKAYEDLLITRAENAERLVFDLGFIGR